MNTFLIIKYNLFPVYNKYCKMINAMNNKINLVKLINLEINNYYKI